VCSPAAVGGRILFGLSYEYAFLAAASAVGLVRLAYDPRLALGCGLVWATVALRIGYGNVVFGFGGAGGTAIFWCTAMILGAGVARLALLRRERAT
jgi:hypothetical protein